ncbi:MAG: 5'-methylthioadenosine/S-adenosylhomocysteine nucleosidase [Chloroflexota bacterium]
MRKLSLLLMILVLLLSVSTVFGQSTEEATPTDPPTPTNTAVVDTDTPVPTDTPTPTNTEGGGQNDTPTPTLTPSSQTTDETTPGQNFTPTPTYTSQVGSTRAPTPTRTPTQPPNGKLDNTPRIAVISAYAPELTVLLAKTTVENTYIVNGVEFMTGNLAGNDVVLFLSGVSMVNAAMNTQLGLDHFNVTHIIFSGIAGGVNPDYHIGDVVIAAQWAQYQESIAARETAPGTYTPPSWASAPFANFEFWFPQNVNVRSTGNNEGEAKFWFKVDADMLALAKTVAPTVTLAKCTADKVCMADVPQIHVGGNGVSGATFVDNAAYREFVYKTFDAEALDEETAAAATVAYSNGIPFLAFRSLSDLAGGGSGENEIGTFFQLAADNSASVTVAFLTAWAAQ